MRRTLFAAGEDQKRFTINGVLLEIGCSELKMVSTDGHRLCVFRMMLGTGSDLSFECLILIKAVRELAKILLGEIRLDKEAEIKIKKGNRLEFEIGSRVMTAREISGRFPNWEMVVPKEFAFFAEINAGDFLNALARVACLADDTHRRVELCFIPISYSLRRNLPKPDFRLKK